MPRGDRTAVIRFRGAPPGLEALVPAAVIAGDNDQGTASVSIEGVDRLSAIDATEVAPGVTHLHIGLPETTPPGTYEGKARVGDADLPLVAEVEPWPSLRFTPAMIRILATAREKVTAHVAVLNAGNVALELGKAQAFGLFADEGLERAFGTAFRHDVGRGEDRFSTFVEGLAENHAGLVRVEVAEGAGSIEPGEVRDVGLVLHLPERLVEGRTYTGSLAIHGFGLQVVTIVTRGETPVIRDEAPPRRATRTRKAG